MVNNLEKKGTIGRFLGRRLGLATRKEPFKQFFILIAIRGLTIIPDPDCLKKFSLIKTHNAYCFLI